MSSSAADGVVTASGLAIDTTTLVVDAANNRVGIGTTSPAVELDVAGQGQFSSSTTRVLTTNYDSIGGFVYHSFEVSGTEQFQLSGDVTNGWIRLQKPAGSVYWQALSGGNIALGNGELANAATDGFVMIPTTATAAPSGTPTALSGYAAMVFDPANKKLYVYNTDAAAWESTTLA